MQVRYHLRNFCYIIMILKPTVGETTQKNMYELAINYYDARAKKLGLPKTEGIFIHYGPISSDAKTK